MNVDKYDFLLSKEITYLNHGSFGACPKPVFKKYQEWQLKLERQPVKFLTNELYQGLKESRISLANLVGCEQDEIIFFQNPTTAVTNIIHNLKLKAGDEVLMTNHEYGALIRAWSEWAKIKDVKIIQQEIPIPLETEDAFVEQFLKGVSQKTKVIFISQITSQTGLIFPIEKIIKYAKEQNIITIVDGAHVPGHIELDIQNLGCDFYTGAIHKWLCGPKGSSFLFVKREQQETMKPVVFSWGKDGDDPEPSNFLQDFQWQGTRDMSAFLSIPFAIDFFKKNIYPSQKTCRELNIYAYKNLNEFLTTRPLSIGSSWIGQMVAHPLPEHTPLNFKSVLLEKHSIEVPIFTWNNQTLIRVSTQVYNDKNDIDYLMSVLKTIN
jgi:isopenicillin-N epimerase